MTPPLRLSPKAEARLREYGKVTARLFKFRLPEMVNALGAGPIEVNGIQCRVTMVSTMGGLHVRFESTP